MSFPNKPAPPVAPRAMARCLPLLVCLLLCSCQTVRTVYDENGHVVDPDAPGGEKDLYEHLNKQFNDSFSTKKGEDGIPITSSNKVSSYQRKRDESGRLDKEFSTSEYAGGREAYSTMRFSDQGKVYSTKEAYTGDFGKRMEKELHPDFVKSSRGLYSTDATYTGSNLRSPLQDRKSADKDTVFPTSAAPFSRESTSGYVETRRDLTPPPRVYTRDEYYGKSIEETRALLGRDKKKE